MPAAFSALFALSANVAIGLCACAAICWRFSAESSTHWCVAASYSCTGVVCTTARKRLLPSAYTLPQRVRGVSVPAELGTESVPDWFLGYSYVSFLFCALLSRTFFSIEGYEKSPSRRAREPLCIFRWYDSNTLLQRVHPRF